VGEAVVVVEALVVEVVEEALVVLETLVDKVVGTDEEVVVGEVPEPPLPAAS
jgi:hypothetical protein